MEEDHNVMSSLLHEDNNFTVVDRKEVGGGESGEDANKVSSTSGLTGEEHDEDPYLSRYSPEESGKLIDFEDISSSNASNVQEADILVKPDWGPYNVTNSRVAPDQFEPMSSSVEADVLKEFIPPSTTTNTIDTTPFTTDPSLKSPPHGHDNVVGDSACHTWFCSVDPRVLDLIYWRDLKKTGTVFGTMLFILLALNCFTILSVASYLSLAVLAITLSFRGYKSVLQAVQKTGDQHPFKEYLDMDLEYSRETIDKAVAIVTKHLNGTVKELRRLFLVEDIIDSLKFFLLLWVFTYIGAWFNGLTLVTLVVVTAFSLPKLYETYQVPIDNYIDLARTQVTSIMAQIQDKVPFLKKKAKTQ